MASIDLGSARHWAARLQRQAATPGAVCIDATMGNGHDTLALCEAVGDGGLVHAFDIQAQAVERTRARLEAAGILHRAALHHAGHERIDEFVAQSVDLVVFNLGWLPGSPDKAVTTRPETTLIALETAARLLKPGGLITIAAYPGHDTGARELDAISAWAARLPSARFQALSKRYLNQPPAAPVLLAVTRIHPDP